MKFGEDFGQKVDLTASIRNILRNYPEGTAVLKELIQNADDARAQVVSFCLDCRSHSKSTLANPVLESFQGPSLVVYNDSVFTESDFESIQRIGDSIKKSSETKTKIGRFGIGFNAVYHWTDLPSFISAKYLVMLDPQAKFLPDVNPSNPGKIVNWVQNPTFLNTYKDQFDPYRGHGSLTFSNQAYNGTIFRLPLRTPEQARTSRLSTRVMTIQEAQQLLEQLASEASSLLLFLKYITTIQISIWLPNTTAPNILFKANIKNMTSQIRDLRANILDTYEPQSANILTGDYTLLIDCFKNYVQSSESTTIGLSSSSSSSSTAIDASLTSGSYYTETWVICNQLGGIEANKISTHPSHVSLRLVPWGGVASLLYTTNTSSSPPDLLDMSSDLTVADPIQGHAYCFLSLPVKTGLPIMVNGFFELSSNRRDVWQEGTDMTGDGKIRAEWNISIMTSIIAPCYIRLLHQIKASLGYTDRYQQYWPSVTQITTPWMYVVNAMMTLSQQEYLLLAPYQRVAHLRQPMEPSSSSSSTLIDAPLSPTSALSTMTGPADVLDLNKISSIWSSYFNQSTKKVMDTLKNNTSLITHSLMKNTIGSPTKHFMTAAAPYSTDEWIQCRNAILLPDSFFQSLNSDTSIVIGNYLLYCQQPYVECTPSLNNTLLHTQTATQTADPPYIRSILRKNSQATISFIAALQNMASYFYEFMISYVMSDLKIDSLILNISDKSYLTATQLTSLTNVLKVLHQLPILPLYHNQTGVIYIWEENQRQMISQLLSMGYSYMTVINTCLQYNFDFNEVIEYINAPSSVGSINLRTYILSQDDEEIDLFSSCMVGESCLINYKYLGTTALQLFKCPHIHTISNIKTLDKDTFNDMLTLSLPHCCLNGEIIHEDRLIKLTSSQRAGDFQAFVRRLWKYLSSHSTYISKISPQYAVLPTVCPTQSTPSLTYIPLSTNFNIIASVKDSLTLPSSIINILHALQVHIVDSSIIDATYNYPNEYWNIVKPPTRQGLLHVLVAALAQSQSQPTFPSNSSRDNSVKSHVFDTLSYEQRRELSQYLLTCESLQSITTTELNHLRQLPLFMTYNYGGIQFISLNNRTAATASLFMLSDTENISPFFLSDKCMKYDSSPEKLLLEQLKVPIIPKTTYILEHIIPSASKYYATHSAEYLAMTQYILRLSNTLSSEQNEFATKLKESQFIPNNNNIIEAGLDSSSSTISTLYRPVDLFDPSEAELVSLLDASFFPHHTLCEIESLSILRKLGLQTSLEWGGVIVCAKSIAAMSHNDDVTAHTTNAIINSTASISDHLESSNSVHSTSEIITGNGNREKVRRSHELLRYIDKHISKLMREELKDNSKNQTKKETGAFSLFRLKSIFGDFFEEDTNKAMTNRTPQDYMTELTSIAWLPVLSTVPSTYPITMPWFNRQHAHCTASPQQCRMLQEVWYSSATHYILPPDIMISDQLQECFGWTKPLSGSNIAIQLRELVIMYDTIKHNKEDMNTDKIDDVIKELITHIPLLYRKLDRQVVTDGSMIRDILDSVSWIWVGSQFVDISKVAKYITLNVFPYLHAIPIELQICHELMNLFQFQTHFSSRDYIEVLRLMSLDTGVISLERTNTDVSNTTPASSVQTGQVLSDSQLDLAVSLATQISTEAGIDPYNIHIYIPDIYGRLGLSTELMNDDVPWLSGPEYHEVRKGCRFIHPNISSLVADRLGVKSLRLSKLNSTLNQTFFVSDSDNGQMEAFGQSESITNRLRTILDLYPEGDPVFSELIQNADDAGATVVKFLLDENSYSTESLIDPKMATLQGPSLLVYNDGVFLESDFRSLAKIGQASKIEKLATTGRFGLGFSSTYHVTDTPGFISGDYLVIFDPHCMYVPTATKNQPGLRVKLSDSQLKHLFKDQLMPYQQFGCTCDTYYQGTLFRFPIRSATQAKKSEISKRSYTLEDMHKYMSHFSHQLGHFLMFLRSVKRLEIYVLDKDSTTPRLLHSVQASVTNTRMYNDQHLLHYFEKKSNSSSNSVSSMSRDEFYQKLMNTHDSKLPTYHQKLTIISKSYTHPISSDLATNSSNISNNNNNNNNHPISVSTVESSHCTREEESEYFIYAGIRGGEAKRMACSTTLRHLKLIPMGSVACCTRRQIRVREDGSDSNNNNNNNNGVENTVNEVFPSMSGQVFCFLPLPIQHGLPVHINGYWELSSNRRDIWTGDDTSGEAKSRSEWNKHMMKDVISDLYSQMIEVLFSYYEGNNTVYTQLLSLLPCPVPKNHWEIISLQLFQLIQTKRLFRSQHKDYPYVSLQEAHLLLPLHKNEEEANVSRLETLLVLEGIKVVRLPITMSRTLLEYKIVTQFINPKYVRHFYQLTHSTKKKYNAITPNTNMDQKTAWDNAIFLLQYSVQDLKPEEFETLVNVCLMPMEDHSVKSIGDTMDPPIYLATDSERMLLTNAHNYIIAGENIIGNTVMSILKNPEFQALSNVRKLTEVDVLRLLQSILPSPWFAADTTIVNAYNIIEPSWFHTLWDYIVENKCLSLFRDIIPICPVTDPRGTSDTIYLVKISVTVPVLADNKLIDITISSCLFDIGIYIFNHQFYEKLSYISELNQNLLPCTSAGILDAFNSSDVLKRQDYIRLWTPTACESFRTFILDVILVNVSEALSTIVQDNLCTLPIWTFHSSKEGTQPFGSIDKSVHKIPTALSTTVLFNHTYVKLRNRDDIKKYQLLGLPPPITREEFFRNVAYPAMHSAQYAYQDLDNISYELLKLLPELSKENPSFLEVTSQQCLVKTQDSSYACIGELYDPTIETLRTLLPSSSFPADVYVQDYTLWSSLRLIGLKTKITSEGFLHCARSIDKELRVGNVDPSQMTALQQRSKALLLYFSQNIETLLSVDYDDIGTMYVYPKDEQGSIVEDSSYIQELRKLVWIPCYTDSPLMNNTSVSILPWSSELHNLSFTSSFKSRLVDDLWYCSHSHRIVHTDIALPKKVKDILKWSEPLSGHIVASQLICISDSAVTFLNSEMTQYSRTQLYDGYREASIKLLAYLDDCLQREVEVQASSWMQILNAKSILWIGNKFIAANHVAFHVPNNLSLEPYFYTVPTYLSPFTSVLRQIGVKDSFDAHDLVNMLKELYDVYRDQVLPVHILETSLGIVASLGIMMRDGAESSDIQESLKPSADSNHATVTNADTVDPPIDSIDDNLATSSPTDSTTATAMAMASKTMTKEKITLKQLGRIYIPDTRGILASSVYLIFDDAKWLSQNLRNRDKKSTIRFSHDRIHIDDAKMLGARSLRDYLFTGDQIMCPEVDQLKRTITSDSLVDALKDLLAVADTILKAKSIHIVYDERHHPAESLMNPALSSTQGPSLMVYMDGPVLNSEAVLQLLSNMTMFNSYTPDAINVTNIHDELYLYPKCGKRLASLFSLTDCLQIISGRELFMFDPTGEYLLQNNDATSSTTASYHSKAKGQKSYLVRNTISPTHAYSSSTPKSTTNEDDEDLIDKFPDQFIPFTSLPFGLEQNLKSNHIFRGLLIRVPLRQQPSSLSNNVMSLEDIKHGLRIFKSLSVCTLTLGTSLLTSACHHWDPADSTITSDYQVSLVTNPAQRMERYQLLTNHQWKKTGILALFMKPFDPVEVSTTISLLTKIKLPMISTSESNTSVTADALTQDSDNWLNWSAEDLKSFIRRNENQLSHVSPKMTPTHITTTALTEIGFLNILDEYITLSILGAGKIREEVCKEPFQSFELRPLTTIVIRRMEGSDFMDYTCPPDIGYLCCGGVPLQVTGLPFHIDGQFIEHTYDRFVPTVRTNMTLSTTTRLRYARGGCRTVLNYIDIQTWNVALIHTALESVLPILYRHYINRLGRSSSDHQGFYKIWPYISRMTSTIQQVMVLSNYQQVLYDESLFLAPAHWKHGKEVLFPQINFKNDVIDFLKSTVMIGLFPSEVTQDMLSNKKIKLHLLTPSSIRRCIQNQSIQHMTISIALELLQYCLSDLSALSTNTSTYQSRMLYTELRGCPLLLSCTGHITPFPIKNRMFIVSLSLVPYISSMKAKCIHPTIVDNHPIFKDTGFLESTLITNYAIIIANEIIETILPNSWKNHDAVMEWSPPSSSTHRSDDVHYVSRQSHSNTGDHTTQLSRTRIELLLYTIWRDMLAQVDKSQLGRLNPYPFIPVVCNNRRILLSSQYLTDIFMTESTMVQETHRNYLKTEADRLTHISTMELNKVVDSVETSSDSSAQSNSTASRDWHWIHTQVACDRKLVKAIDSTNDSTIVSNDGNNNEVTQASITAMASLSSAPTMAISATDSVVTPPTQATVRSREDRASNISYEDERRQQEQLLDPLSVELADLIQTTLSTILPPPVPQQSTVNAMAPIQYPVLSVDIHRILQKLGVPYVDHSLYEVVPAAIVQQNQSTQSQVKRMLLTLYNLFERDLIIYHSSDNTHDVDNAESPSKLIDFTTISTEERIQLLMTLADENRIAAYSSLEIDKIKSLQLFTPYSPPSTTNLLTTSASGTIAPISLIGRSQGVYYYSTTTNNANDILTNITSLMGTTTTSSFSTYPSSITSSSSSANILSQVDNSPIILVNDARLNELYSILGVVDLTPALAVKQFLLPELMASSTTMFRRMEVMMLLADRWDIFKADTALVDSLKNVAFIPSWDLSTWTHITDFRQCALLDLSTVNAKCAKETFSWENHELMKAIPDLFLCDYYVPPIMRTTAIHMMMVDIGMLTEMTSDELLKIALKLQDLYTTKESTSSTTTTTTTTATVNKGSLLDEASNESSGNSLYQVSTYGRNLLRYIRQDSKCYDILNRSTCTKLSTIKFVPAQYPTQIEDGAFIHYEMKICSFNQFAVKNIASLIFSTHPILDDDLTLSSNYYTWLGVITEPSLKSVWSHFEKLTSHSDTLYRWNHAINTPEVTFSELFTFLYNHWSEMTSSMKQYLMHQSVVPVGSILISSSRLYFKLSQDLTPFMYEVPRIYGMHEAYLKLIGVRETPTIEDYIRFLQILAEECHLLPLNINELHAVLIILTSIVTMTEEYLETVPQERSGGNLPSFGGNEVFLPDEKSILRPVSQCIHNDDSWKKQFIDQSLTYDDNYYILHPLITQDIINCFQVNKLTELVIEVPTTSTSSWDSVDNEVAYQSYVKSVISTHEVIQQLYQLQVHSLANESITTNQQTRVYQGSNDIYQLLLTCQYRFVKNLDTTIVFKQNTYVNRSNTNNATSTSKVSLLYIQSETTNSTVYINCGLLSPMVSIDFILALSMTHILNLPSLAATTITYILSVVPKPIGLSSSSSSLSYLTSNSSHTVQQQDGNDILSYLRMSIDPKTLQEKSRGIPGERVIGNSIDYHRIEFKPFRVFAVGEIIIYNQNDISISITSSSNTINSSPNQTLEENLDYRYGKVIKIYEQDEYGVKKLLIKTGAATTHVFLSTSIHTLQSTRTVEKSNQRQSTSQANNSSRDIQKSTSVYDPKASSQRLFISSPNSMKNDSLVTTESTHTVSYQRDVQDALQQLLHRVGIPASLEVNDMMTRIVELKESVQHMERQLTDERSTLTETKGKLEKVTAVFQCQICVLNRVDQVLAPCGHIFCHDCIDKIRGQKCPYCRCAFHQRITFFPPNIDDEDSTSL